MSDIFPLENIRQSIDKQWEQVNIIQPFTVPSNKQIRLNEAPDDGTVNLRPVITGLTETTVYPPSAGQFYINYCTGYVEFNDDEIGNSYSIDYWGKGSVVDSNDINYINDKYVISSVAPSGYYGQQWYNTINGITYTYDIRNKWLSQNRNTFSFGRRGLTNNQYLNFYAGTLASNTSGVRILRDGCITGMTAQIKSLGTCSFYIRSNNNSANIAQMDIISDIGNENDNYDININKGDFLQCYFDSVFTTIRNPLLILEIAWR